MITPDEAVKTMDALIESIPIHIRTVDNFGFMVSKQVAQALLKYAPFTPIPKDKVFVSGDEFRWKGFKCQVA